MLKFSKFVIKEEQKEKHHVMAFMRANPPHEGHNTVVNKVHEIAKEHKAGHSVVLSHSTDPVKNPLTPEQKLKHAKRAFAKGTNVSTSSKEKPTILHAASDIHKSRTDHLHVVTGSDRVEGFKKLLHDYNGKEGPHGHYHFKSITVHSAGERDPDAEGTSGVSATKMREAAKKGDRETFHSGASSNMSPKHKDEMMKDLSAGMSGKRKLKESTSTATGLGGGLGSHQQYLDTNALDQEDVNANFLDYISKAKNGNPKIAFNNTYKPGGGRPSSAVHPIRKRKRENQ